MLRFCLIFTVTMIAVQAQIQAPATVQATGTASISVAPDQAQFTAGVVTTGSTAQDAAQQNATQTAAMLTALKAVLGNNGTVQTVGYSVSPRYTNSQPATIIGYTASNTVQVTTTNLT